MSNFMKIALCLLFCITLTGFSAISVNAGFLYGLNEGGNTNNQIHGFYVNEATGALTALAGFPVNTGGFGVPNFPGQHMAIDPVNLRLFALDASPPRFRVFTINPVNGTLTPVNYPTPVNLGIGNWNTIVVHPSGSPVIVGSGEAVRSYVITSTTAVEAAGSPYSIGAAQSFSSVLSRDGSFYYTGGNSGSLFAGFSVNAATGELAPLPGSPFDSGANFPLAFATDSQNRLFSANSRNGQLRVFQIGIGVPNPVAGNPFASNLGEAIYGILSLNEQFYFVADRSGNRVGSYRINGSGNATILTAAAAPVSSAGIQTNTLALNQSGSFLFAGNGDSRNVTTYSLNQTTGALSFISIQPNGALGPPSGYSAGIIYLPRNEIPRARKTAFDFEGDGKADIAVFRPSNGTWYLNRTTAGFRAAQFGISTDKLAPADYDGDGNADIAVFRDGVWYLLRSSGGFTAVQFGATGDIPAPGDYDGDGKDDIAVFRPGDGVWYLLRSRDGFAATQFGANGDKTVQADYDGDGKTDLAVFRSGVWYLLQSSQGFTAVQFGVSSDKTVPGDYDGDGKSDLAVYRDGIWYLLQSQLGFTGFQFGVASDTPAPADFDGDGKIDAAVFRDGVWYYLNSSNGSFSAVQFGIVNDKPVSAAYVQ